MRILHVIGSLNPADGGPPEAVLQLARAYASLGVGVEVLCQDEPNQTFLQSLSFPVHALGQRLLGRFGLSPRLWTWLHHNAARYDAIVLNGIWIFPNVAVRSAARRAGKPYAVFPHGGLDPWFNRKYPLKHLKKLFYWPFQYPVLRDARAVFFTTAAECDLAATSFRPCRWNGIPVPYGVSDPEGDPSAQIDAFFSQFPALRNRRYLLYLARLHEKKGCDLLLQAFAALASTFPDVDLVMAGPDQVGLQAKLQRMAQDLGIAHRVHWPGMLTGESKWGALRAADAFVLPSHQENFGISVVESLVAGRPVLISNQVNIWPQIAKDQAGLVDEDTRAGTERLLRRWLELPPAQQKAMASRTYSCFQRNYSMKETVALIQRLFSSQELTPIVAPAAHR